MLTDEDYAKAFRKRKRRYRGTQKEEAKYLESNLQDFLKTRGEYALLSELEQVKLKNRVLRLLRSESAERGAVTRKKNATRKKEAEHRAFLSSLQIGFAFREEPDHDT